MQNQIHQNVTRHSIFGKVVILNFVFSIQTILDLFIIFLIYFLPKNVFDFPQEFLEIFSVIRRILLYIDCDTLIKTFKVHEAL